MNGLTLKKGGGLSPSMEDAMGLDVNLINLLDERPVRPFIALL